MTLRVSNFDDLSKLVPPTKSEDEETGAGVGREDMQSGAALII